MLDQISPGIREVVRFLREHGFETTDSGDGTSNAGMGCAIDIPHVHMACEPDALILEAERLATLLRGKGLVFQSDMEGPCIQATYDVASRVGIISLFQVSNKDIA